MRSIGSWYILGPFGEYREYPGSGPTSSSSLTQATCSRERHSEFTDSQASEVLAGHEYEVYVLRNGLPMLVDSENGRVDPEYSESSKREERVGVCRRNGLADGREAGPGPSGVHACI